MYCFSHKENFREYPIALAMHRKYEFLPQINVVVRRIVEAGLIAKWHRDFSKYWNDAKRIDDHRVILTIDHIGGGLFALLFGIGIASLVLIVECITFRKTEQIDCHPFWLFLSKVVDGRRFYFRRKSHTCMR